MTTSSAILTRERTLMAAVETTTGNTDNSVTLNSPSTQGIFNILDPIIQPTVPVVEREGQGTLSPLAPIPSARMGKATFKSEIVGSGTSTDPLWLSTLLTSCGFKGVSHVYTPVTANATTTAIGTFVGNTSTARLNQIFGAMGKLTINGEAGKPAELDWEFDGVWQNVIASTLPVPQFPIVTPPRVAYITFTVNGQSYKIPKFNIDIGNDLVMREDVTQPGGYLAACITKRIIKVKISPEAMFLNAYSGISGWFDDFLFHNYNGATQFALDVVIGSSTYNTVTISCPNLIQSVAPQWEDANGILRDSLEFIAVRNITSGYYTGGDDEISITAS